MNLELYNELNWRTQQTLEMMGVDGDDELLRRLLRVDQLCEEAGGQLMSRQVIAMMVEQRERDEV